MISFLLFSSSLLNFAFYIYAIGFVVALSLEQVVRRSDNERNIYIVETNRKYLWRQTWVININWFYVILDCIFYQEICNLWVILLGWCIMKKKEERKYAESREELFREFHRVIAPVGNEGGGKDE